MTEDPRFLALWAENAIVEVGKLESISALDAFIVQHASKLGQCEQQANGAWTRLRDRMHARDGELRKMIREGVG